MFVLKKISLCLSQNVMLLVGDFPCVLCSSRCYERKKKTLHMSKKSCRVSVSVNFSVFIFFCYFLEFRLLCYCGYGV